MCGSSNRDHQGVVCACSFSGSRQEYCLLAEPRLSILLAHLRGSWHGRSWFCKSSWANTSVCLKIWSAGEPALGDAVLQACVGKGASQPQAATLVCTGINPELSQGPLVGRGSYRVKPNWGRKAGKGAGCPHHCLNWAHNPKDLYGWSQEQSRFWPEETRLAQWQLRRGSRRFYKQIQLLVVWRGKKAATWSARNLWEEAGDSDLFRNPGARWTCLPV